MKKTGLLAKRLGRSVPSGKMPGMGSCARTAAARRQCAQVLWGGDARGRALGGAGRTSRSWIIPFVPLMVSSSTRRPSTLRTSSSRWKYTPAGLRRGRPEAAVTAAAALTSVAQLGCALAPWPAGANAASAGATPPRADGAGSVPAKSASMWPSRAWHSATAWG